MAGLGEACTHIAAVLFYLEAMARIRGSSVCTQQKCQWIIPAFQKDIPYLPVAELDFTSAKAKKKKLDEAAINGSVYAACSSSNPAQPSDVLPPRTDELESFFHNISRCKSSPGILSLVPEFQDRYIPKTSLPEFPTCLQDLFDPQLAKATYPSLASSCESVQIDMSEEMARNVEEATREQSRSKLWYKYRAGRVTASKMKRVCRTSLEKPSHRLIKEICYPEAFKFSSKSTCWGCEHENSAREKYAEIMAASHDEFTVASCGLVLNPEWPHLGASPDGVVCCKCCGNGVLEIKCPYCHRYDSVKDLSNDSSSCLKTSDLDNSLHLDQDHAYYFQVQTQIFLSQVAYSDFCVCTFPPGTTSPQIHIERIYPNYQLWHTCVDKSTEFFQTCLLPELLGRWYSQGPSLSSHCDVSISGDQTATAKPADSVQLLATNDRQDSTSQLATDGNYQCMPSCSTSSSSSSCDTQHRLYCYCQQPEGTDEMIGCDNPACAIEWFHTSCLKLKRIPKGKWYCPDCRVNPSPHQ